MYEKTTINGKEYAYLRTEAHKLYNIFDQVLNTGNRSYEISASQALLNMIYTQKEKLYMPVYQIRLYTLLIPAESVEKHKEIAKDKDSKETVDGIFQIRIKDYTVEDFQKEAISLEDFARNEVQVLEKRIQEGISFENIELEKVTA